MNTNKQFSSTEKFYAKELCYERLDKEQQKKDNLFILFLYVSLVMMVIFSTTIIIKFAVTLGVFGMITASLCTIGWLSAYLLIILNYKSDNYNYLLCHLERDK